jgi:hypothetical protein
MDIYTLISSKAKKRKSFESTQEYKFFVENRHLLDKLNKFPYVSETQSDDFNIIRINILLKSLINKLAIEKEVSSLGEYISNGEKVENAKFIQTIRDKTLELPYFNDGKNKLFIPIFSRAINFIYSKETYKLLSYPYNELIINFKDSMIDPFDLYGYEIYNSYFTRLVQVGVSSDKKEAVYFHYDTNTLYFINDQGRLDKKLVLFDKYIKRITTSHMLERIKPVVNAYFTYDREAFIKALVDGKFISMKMLSIIKKG